jgi:hypothetical protein
MAVAAGKAAIALRGARRTETTLAVLAQPDRLRLGMIEALHARIRP